MIKRLALILAALLAPSIASAQTTYQSTVIALSPCYYWYMDATSGTAEANHGNAVSNSGLTYVNTPTLNQTGIPGNSPSPSVLFNGTTQYATATPGGGGSACAASGTRPFANQGGSLVNGTLLMWQKSALAGAVGYYLATRVDVAGVNYVVNFSMGGTSNTGKIKGGLWTAPGGTVADTGFSTAACAANAWCFIGMKETAATPKLQLYVNGTPDASTTSFSDSPGTATNFSVGARTDGGTPFPGYIDEVIYTDTLISDADIASLYTLGSTIPATGGLNAYSVKFEAPRLIPGMPTWSIETYGNERLPLPSGPYAPQPKFIHYYPVERGMYVHQ